MSTSKSITLRGPAYWRRSDSRQEMSIADQKEWAYPECRREGIEITREFHDDGIAGSELESRPGFQAMLAWCEAEADAGRPQNTLVNWMGDRFSRSDSIRTNASVQRLRDAGVTSMFSAEGWVHWEEPNDRILWALKQELSREGYVRDLSRNVVRAQRQRALEGRWMGGRPPLGYVVGAGGKLALGEPARVALAGRIFDLYDGTPAGGGEIAGLLNREGHRTVTGRPWTRGSVLEVLSNRRYLGEARWGEKTRAKYHCGTPAEVARAPDKAARAGRQRRRGLKRLPLFFKPPEDVVVVPGAHPAIITPEQFARVQAKRLAADRGRCSPKGSQGRAPLSGLVFCGDCGGAMHGCRVTCKMRGKTYRYDRYVCGTSRRSSGACRFNGVDQAGLLTGVLGGLAERLSTAEALGELRAEAARVAALRDDADGATRARLEGRLAGLTRDLATAGRNLALASEDVRDAVEDVIRQLRAEEAQIAGDLAALDRPAEEETSAELLEEVIGELPRLAGLGDEATPAEVRGALELLVRKVTVVFAPRGATSPTRRARVEGVEVEYTDDLLLFLGLPRRCDLLSDTSGRTPHLSTTLRLPWPGSPSAC